MMIDEGHALQTSGRIEMHVSCYFIFPEFSVKWFAFQKIQQLADFLETFPGDFYIRQFSPLRDIRHFWFKAG